MKVDSCLGHENHLFQSPLCSKQSLSRRVFNVIFHIITLFIPLLIYRISAACRGTQQLSVSLESITSVISGKDKKVGGDDPTDPLSTGSKDDLSSKVQEPINVHLPLSNFAQEVVRFVEELLEKECPVLQDDYFMKLYQPSLQIAKLRKLEFQYSNKLIELLKAYLYPHTQDNVWADENVLHTADISLKLSFMISLLTLDAITRPGVTDHNYFYDKLKNNAYAPKTLLYVATNYHDFRSCKHWREEVDTFWMNELHKMTPTSMCFTGLKAFPENEEKFYIEGSFQHAWRSLYNEFCDLLRSKLSFENQKIDLQILMKTLYDGKVMGERLAYLNLLSWVEQDLVLEKKYTRPASNCFNLFV